jgi:hypothetical protein
MGRDGGGGGGMDGGDAIAAAAASAVPASQHLNLLIRSERDLHDAVVLMQPIPLRVIKPMAQASGITSSSAATPGGGLNLVEELKSIGVTVAMLGDAQ